MIKYKIKITRTDGSQTALVGLQPNYDKILEHITNIVQRGWKFELWTTELVDIDNPDSQKLFFLGGDGK